MQRGFTIGELVVVLGLAAVLAALFVPRLGPAIDRIATDGAARDLTTAISVARTTAVMHGTRTRLYIAPDSLRVDRESLDGWSPYARWPGPRASGVSLTVTSPVLMFNPIGLGWGLANTKIVLRRGSQTETITTSRLGRVKLW